jgi:N-acetylated-alpha-linked acidic dipeptidase
MDPQTGVSIKERKYAKKVSDAVEAGATKIPENKNMQLNALGAGSDWSGFLQYLGITTLSIQFGGEGNGGEYHSIYDSYDHYTRFKDPGFKYGLALAKTAGRIIMRMANADVLPVSYSSFSETVGGYITEVKTLLDNSRLLTDVQNKLINDSSFYLANDPKLKIKVPKAKETVPYLDFSGLENALAALKKSAKDFNEKYPSAIKLSKEKQQALNNILSSSERTLLSANGLPRRPWYKHQIYAPGIYTGYGVKTLPGIREAIEQRNWKEAQENIGIVTQRLNEYNAQVVKAEAVVDSQ